MKLRIENLHKSYEKNEVLKGVDFSFEQGKIYGLLGRNGAGKTTLFRCLINDLAYEQGQCYLSQDGESSVLNSDQVAFVISQPKVPDFLTGYEFLKFFIDFHYPEESKDSREALLDRYFSSMSILPKDQHKLLGEYSHGMKNKLLMLVNILLERQLLLLDEPLTSVDVVASEEIKSLLREYKERQITILSTHITLIALVFAMSK
ncbi:MAG: ATP-binding cassette domain-containing protein [Eubacteriales bacterium]|nr:ATP-binding cassette domain-containing protein [Eubacteriales bacterium]